MNKKNETDRAVLLFDGVCNLCKPLVIFVIKRDPQGKFRFASLQGDAGQDLLKKFNLATDDFDSFIYIADDQYYTKSSAALKVCQGLGGLWQLLYPLILIPKPLRDVCYQWIAKNRYRWFGKKDTCMIPSPDIKKRFLE